MSKPYREKKDVVLRVRITGRTLERLETEAKRRNIKPSAFARHLIHEGLKNVLRGI